MKSKIITAALTAAAFAGLVASSCAQAQTYGGGPECGFGHSFDPVTQSCVSNRNSSADYGRRAYSGRVHHSRYIAHRAHEVRVARKAGSGDSNRQ